MLLWTALTGDAPVTAAEVNAPSLWSAGIEWGPAETEGATWYWQTSPNATARTGKPSLCIAIGGYRIVNQLQSAQWALGRSDWLSTLSPNGASFSFVGVLDAQPNDTIVVSLESDVTDEHSDALWVGRVDTVTETQDTAGNYWTSVSGTDIIGVLGQAAAPTFINAQNFADLVTGLALDAGIGLTVDDFGLLLPSLLADGTTEGTVLELINRAEVSANTLLFLTGSGHLAARQRAGLDVTSVDVIDLSGINGYKSWTEQTSVANIINKWEFKNSSGSYDVTITNDASIALYGEHSFSVDDMLRDDAAYGVADTTQGAGDGSGLIGGDGLIVMGEPRGVVTNADFPITDLAQDILFVDPLDFVQHDDDTLQVMGVQHDVSAGGLEWTVTITADQTQDFLVGGSDPTPDSVAFTDTQTVTSTKSSYVVKQSGGSFQGSGADDYIPVGLDNGDVYRGLFDFSGIVWPVNFLRVRKCTMYLTTTTQQRITFGSAPKVEIRRITNGWTEGTVGDPPTGANSVIWPGPGTSTAGQKVVRVNNSETNTQAYAITEIAQGWHDDPDGNHGLRVAAVSEDSTKYAVEFYSDDHSTHKPYIVLVCDVSA